MTNSKLSGEARSDLAGQITKLQMVSFFKKFFSHISSLKPLLVTMPMTDKVLDPKKTEELLTRLLNARIPFACEVVVENLGNHLKFFIAVPQQSIHFLKKTFTELWSAAILEENQEGTIFGSSGVREGSYFLPVDSAIPGSVNDFLKTLHMFSRIELVDEGLALQVVCVPSNEAQKLNTNIRLIASASTPFRTKEIIAHIAATYPSWKISQTSRGDIIDRFVHREFSDAENLKLAPYEITQIFYF